MIYNYKKMKKEIQNKFTITRLKKEISILQSYIRMLKKADQLKDKIILSLQQMLNIDKRIIKTQENLIKRNQRFFIITMILILTLWIFNLYINK